MGPDKLELSDRLLLGRRATRDTYIHPHKPEYVLKIEVRSVPKKTRWHQRPVRIPTSMERELTGYADMMVRLGRHYDFIGRILGLAETSRGPAILAENVTHDCEFHGNLRDLATGKTAHDLSHADRKFVLNEYTRISELLVAHRVYNFATRIENVMLCRTKAGLLCLRLYDYKTLIYRQLISPRFIPGGEHYEQQRVIKEGRRKLSAWVSVT